MEHIFCNSTVGLLTTVAMATRHVPIKAYLANSTMSTASGAAICLSVGPNWCTQLSRINAEGNKDTPGFILGKCVVIMFFLFF